MIIKSFVKTLSGTEAQALSDGTVKAVPVSAKIYADSGDTVYIGGADVSPTNGFLLPTSPADALSLGEFSIEGGALLDLTQTYVIGSDGDKVRVAYLKDITMV